jgi:hypothetical protein
MKRTADTWWMRRCAATPPMYLTMRTAARYTHGTRIRATISESPALADVLVDEDGHPFGSPRYGDHVDKEKDKAGALLSSPSKSRDARV